jgi:hypothetical protein
MEDIYYEKYIKYKTKYLELKELNGGMSKISMPKISMPKISMPKINMPKISMPKISMPKISMPKISMSKPCEKLEHRQPNAHYYTLEPNSVIVEHKDRTDNHKTITFNLATAITRNTTQERHINNIYEPLLIILNSLIIIYLKKLDYKQNFEYILQILEESKNSYNSYFKTIRMEIDIKKIDDKLNTIREQIKVNERSINEKIDKINKNDKLNTTINTEINKTTSFNHIFTNKNKNEGICSLKYIIRSYFNKVIDGLECLISIQYSKLK